MNTKILGNKGERIAKEYLVKKGFKILKQNYKNKIGEIDIICYNKKDDEIVFVEVKTRESHLFGTPSDAVDLHKQNKIKNTATFYLLKQKKLDSKFRFDVVEIFNDKVNHIEYAF